jgi:hypothetical protein
MASLAGLVTAIALVVAAAPAGATLVCPPGTTNKNYCTNVVPIAGTTAANGVSSTSAVLNGVAGPGIANGDVTSYVFEYGTSISYGTKTTPGTVGSCPSGAGAPTYCQGVPAAQSVSAKIVGLAPCTMYHYRVDASNPDGSTSGNDQTFITGFLKPIVSVHHAKKVKHNKKFKISIKLRTRATLTITLKKGRKTVKTVRLGSHTGVVTTKIKAPKKRGKYTLNVKGAESCGQQTNVSKVTVK